MRAMKAITPFFLIFCLLLTPVSALTIEDVNPSKPGMITPESPLYFLDTLLDDLSLKFWSLMQALRLADDEKVAQEMIKVIAERKAELKELEDKGRIHTRLYENLKERIQERIKEYNEYTKPKLSVEYSINGYEVTVILKNVWDREIGYITGGIKAKSDSGKEISYESPIPYPLNLKPGEEKAFTATIPSEYAGNWTVTVHIQTWDGHRLIKETFEVTIPS